MKSLKLIFVFLVTISFTSCVTTLPINQQFYSPKKVGVIIQIDSASMAKDGAQGLLDMALTPGNKFKEPLQKLKNAFEIKELITKSITEKFNSKNKQHEFFYEKINVESKPKFSDDVSGSNKKYHKHDLRNYKEKYKVDEIFLVTIKHGVHVSYYGVIELDKKGYTNISCEIIDLTDNSYMLKENINSLEKIIGKWNEGDNLKNAINVTLINASNTFKAKL